jgi:hypothetical protein
MLCTLIVAADTASNGLGVIWIGVANRFKWLFCGGRGFAANYEGGLGRLAVIEVLN